MRFIATVELIVCWFAWGYPFIFRAPHSQKRESITAPLLMQVGLLLEAVGIFVAWAFRLPAAGAPGVWRMVGSMILGPVAGVISWLAVRRLGRQFRVQAGLYADHELVRTGPYALVRHPIYASLMAILLSTALLLTPWEWLAVSLGLFVIGTELRIRTEDGLLAARFGQAFEEYKKKVPAYIPFVR
jgi:protein-S-isoprenylcysteine O-methyltransferase Ste14